MNFEEYRKKYPPRSPRYAEKSWFRFDWFVVEFSCKWFALLFQFFRSPRFFNIIYIKDDLQGDGEWIFVIAIFWLSFKFEVGVPDIYRFERLKKPIDWRFSDWLNKK